MSKQGRPWLKGVQVAGLCLVIYTLLLWVFLSVAFFVVSMEEGGGILNSSIPITLAIVLLSQGIGFHSGSITLSVIPLLLTALLVWLVAWLARRLSVNLESYLAALVLWEAAMLLYAANVTVVLTDTLPIVALKTAIVFTFGYLVGALPGSRAFRTMMDKAGATLSERMRRTLRLGLKNALWLLTGYLALGLLTVLVWTFQNHAAMFRVFDLAGMRTGSRIVTSICTLAWLPNLCIWAVSWLFGGGFRIGELASFTLWSDHAAGLPAVPVFGLFPQAVSSDLARDVLLFLPLACGLVVALVELFSPKVFAINAGRPGKRVEVGRLVASLAHPLVSFVISTVLMSLLATLAFVCSTGALGQNRLRHVGVDSAASTQAVIKPTSIGMFMAWGIAVVLIATVIGVRIVSRRRRAAAISKSENGKAQNRETSQDGGREAGSSE
ncbi:DUF6350 family protein [Bifidobacterium sp. ESL0763]|uniref:cell division protein PerM n=1 Tax=Bifidobacterium sp. ESL0763 TaxID=2983227 RepID=UPI0023F751CD|nr:DUF6350 family protein [Bifidobacterium sp. ESL0763]MDF7663821.1 DUF6350 family protein [Bifidobacterium sp. ESL0763]